VSRPRYSIYVGWKSVDTGAAELCYMFRDHVGEGKTDASDTLIRGMPFLYRNNNFVSMRDAHDAIIFCRELNEAKENKDQP